MLSPGKCRVSQELTDGVTKFQWPTLFHEPDGLHFNRPLFVDDEGGRQVALGLAASSRCRWT